MTEKESPLETPEKTPKKTTAAPSPEGQADNNQDDKTSAAQPNWAMRVLLVLIVFLLGSAAAFYALPTLKDRIPMLAEWLGEGNNTVTAGTADLSDHPLIAELRQQLETQATKIAAFQAQGTGAGQDSTVVSAQTVKLQERINSLEQALLKMQETAQDTSQVSRIDRLDQRTNQLELAVLPLSKGLVELQTAQLDRARLASILTEHTGTLKQIEDRLGHVEAYSARDSSGALFAFYSSALRRKLESGQGFSAEVNTLNAMINKGSLALDATLTEALRTLKTYQDGIATPEQLADHFNDLIPALIRSQSNNKSDPWWKNAYYNLKNIIIVRQTDNASPESADDIIGKIQKALKRHDIQEALTYIDRLPATMQAVAEKWAAQAKAYLAAEATVEHLETTAIDIYVSKPKQKQEGQSSW